MDKTKLRQRFLDARQVLSEAQVAEWSASIQTKLEGLVEWENVNRVHVYRPRSEWREVDTGWFTSYLVEHWPDIELTIGDVSRTALMPSMDFDLIIVPVVAFDDECNRLGLGGGWYDRFLATQPQALTVGLAYDLQHASALPTEPHDIALDHVITETRVITR